VISEHQEGHVIRSPPFQVIGFYIALC